MITKGTLYINQASPTEFWIMDNLGSVNSSPITTLADAERYLLERETLEALKLLTDTAAKYGIFTNGVEAAEVQATRALSIARTVIQKAQSKIG